MVISAFTRTQIAALFGTAILTVLPAQLFAGMMTPVSSLTGMGAVMGRLFPMTYFLPISVGTFTKGLGFCRSRRQPGAARAVRPGADAAEPLAAAQTGEVSPACACSPTSSGSAPRSCAASSATGCCSGFVVYSFSLAVIAQAQSNAQELHNASIAIVDEDHSQLSRHIARRVPAALFQAGAVRSPSATSIG